MKFRFEYMSLTQLGELFGATSHQVGKWLVEIGLRTPNMRPSAEAFRGMFVTTGPSRGQGYNYVWHAQRTVAALVDAGHALSVEPGNSLVAESALSGPFTHRHHPKFGCEIVSSDGTVSVWVSGENNAKVICNLLNVANKHGVIERQLAQGQTPGRDASTSSPA